MIVVAQGGAQRFGEVGARNLHRRFDQRRRENYRNFAHFTLAAFDTLSWLRTPTGRDHAHAARPVRATSFRTTAPMSAPRNGGVSPLIPGPEADPAMHIHACRCTCAHGDPWGMIPLFGRPGCRAACSSERGRASRYHGERSPFRADPRMPEIAALKRQKYVKTPSTINSTACLATSILITWGCAPHLYVAETAYATAPSIASSPKRPKNDKNDFTDTHIYG